MRICVLSFDPESVERVQPRISSLWSGGIELEYVYPSVAFDPAESWDEHIQGQVEARLAAVNIPHRIVHTEPRDFISELFGTTPPAVVVLAFSTWTEKVAMTSNMLAMRNFPVLMMGYHA